MKQHDCLLAVPPSICWEWISVFMYAWLNLQYILQALEPILYSLLAQIRYIMNKNFQCLYRMSNSIRFWSLYTLKTAVNLWKRHGLIVNSGHGFRHAELFIAYYVRGKP